MESFDVAIVGGGVVGSAVARELAMRDRGLSILIVEKEPDLALHQSGRNSGVAHVGYNQRPGTLKARLVVEGNRRLRAYCRESGVPIEEGGILVVARSDAERAVLEELLRRGRANGAKVELLSEAELRRKEPHAAGEAALWAPEGASFDSRALVLRLVHDSGAEVAVGEEVTGAAETPGGVRLTTRRRRVRARVLLNAAGLHADRVARRFGAGRGLRIVPFRGEYFDLPAERRGLVRSHIYPAPDPAFPFLGVHLSRRTDGRVSVGPGAALVGGREAYDGWFGPARDLLELGSFPGVWRMAASAPFRRLALREWRKSVSRAAVLEEARRLVPDLRESDLGERWSGIRAQLVDSGGRMVDDLVVEETERSVHVLNAVSPALTCALPLAEEIAGRVLKAFA